jgi:hypothetical protein
MDEENEVLLATRAFLLVLRDHFDAMHRAPRRAIEDVEQILGQVADGDMETDLAAIEIRTRIDILRVP